MLNLEAKTNNEKIIFDYLDKNASFTLAEKINNGKKTLSQCWSYIVAEAQKQAVNGCACIDDATVFGWAIHFFEEDSIEAKHYEAKATVKTTAKAEKKPEPKAEQKPKSQKKPKSELLDQISLF